MKLGVSYNVFSDAIELLEGSIKQIRASVDYISVVFQTMSNYGRPSTEPLELILKNLIERGFIDEIIEYKPAIDRTGYINELRKRNLGLHMVRTAGCTHFLSMDSDEYYKKEEFERAKALIEKDNYDASACKMLTFFKEWCYILDPPEEYYVPFIYKLNPQSHFIFATDFPVLVDPTRRIASKKVKIFDRDTLQMYHASHIRKNWEEKILNSSALVNYNSKIEKLLKEYGEWEYGKNAFLPGNPCIYHKVIKTDIADGFK